MIAPQSQKHSKAQLTISSQGENPHGATTLHPKEAAYPGSLLLPEEMTLSETRRLVVLVPTPDLNTASFAHLIWSMASPRQLKVLFISLVSDYAIEQATIRQLTTLAAITRDAWVEVEIQVLHRGNWLHAIQQIWQPGDVVICHSEQTLRHGVAGRIPLHQALLSTLGIPVFTLSGVYQEQRHEWHRQLLRLPYWIILFTIILGFFAFELQIDHYVKGWTEKLVLCMLLIIEIGIIRAWSSINAKI